MVTQANKLPAATGVQWIRAGWRLFRKQPFSFTALLLFYWLVLLVASAIVGFVAKALALALPFVSVDALALVGGILVAIMTPALTVGFLQACRAAQMGLPAHPVLLFSPFRAGRETVSRLLGLGAVQMCALIVILLMTSGTAAFRAQPTTSVPAAPPTATTTAAPSADTPARPAAASSASDAPPPAGASITPADEQAMVDEAVLHLEQGLAYLPVAMLMWYAPLLVAWHGLPVGKALFFSIVALWRNRAAFAVYGVAWVGVWFLLSMFMALVAVVLNLVNFTAIVMAPVVMVLLTCMYCSMYATYDTVFVDDSAAGPRDA